MAMLGVIGEPPGRPGSKNKGILADKMPVPLFGPLLRGAFSRMGFMIGLLFLGWALLSDCFFPVGFIIGLLFLGWTLLSGWSFSDGLYYRVAFYKYYRVPFYKFGV